MPTQQGSLDLLNDPVAQNLLQSKLPVRLSYVWMDGTPRVVPIGFQWTGKEIVIGTPPEAPKIKALQKNPKVALTIDTDTLPYNVLLIRGTARLELADGIIPEYVQMCYRTMPSEEAAKGWLDQMGKLVSQMYRISITPEWVAIHDFEKRFPSAVERAVERAMAAAGGGQ